MAPLHYFALHKSHGRSYIEVNKHRADFQRNL